MPIGTPFHERTFPLCESLNYREWSGYYTVSAYETHHEHEYNAIRNAAALIDVTPLYKYLVTGRDATRLRRSAHHRATCGRCRWARSTTRPGATSGARSSTTARSRGWGSNRYRWTAADPSLRWFRQNAAGLDVQIEDVSEKVAALALQGPTSAGLLRAVAEADIDKLKYFRVTSGRIGRVAVDISRTGYTGDLGYEIWMDRADALAVWDALVGAGGAFEIKPAGMLALDVARIEAGLLLIEVDFFSSKKALIPSQLYTPSEMGLGRLVSLDKERFVGRAALEAEAARGPARQVSGLELDWTEVETIYERAGLPPSVAATASRVAVPVYSAGRQVGRATSTTWSPVTEKDDRAGDDRCRFLQSWDAAGDGGDRRGRPSPRGRDRRQDAVLQSGEEDGESAP